MQHIEKKSRKFISVIFIFSLFILIFGLYVYPLGDPDVFIHLRDGRYYAEHGLHAANDPFAYTRNHEPIERVEWLFQVGIYSIWKKGGYNLLILLKALLVTLAIGLLGVLIYRRWKKIEITGFIIGLSIILPLSMILPLLRFFQERPYIITYLFLPGILIFLDNYLQKSVTDERAARKWLYAMPFLTVLWVNFHPGFIIVFIFLIAQIVEDGLHYLKENEKLYKNRFINLSLVTIIVFFCSALNPLGFSIYAFIFKTVFTDYLKIIIEWAPPKLSNAWGFFIILGITWFFQIFFIKGSRISDLIKLTVCSYLAIKSYRNIPIFMIAALPILTEKLFMAKEKYFRVSVSVLVKKSLVVLATAVVLLTTVILSIDGQAFQLGEVKTLHPKEGLDWLVKNQIKGNILANDFWGGFIGWQTNNQVKVFIDGRFTIYDKQIFTDYMDIIYGNKDRCLNLLNQYQIQVILIPLDSDPAFFQQLNLSGDWALVYWDHICMIYLKRTGTNRSTIAGCEYKIINPLDFSKVNNSSLSKALGEAERAIAIAPNSYAPYFLKSQLLSAMGENQKAKQEIEQAGPLAPKYLLYMNLGLTEMKLGDFQAAERDFQIVVDCGNTVEMKSQAYFFLAQSISRDPVRRKEALRYAKKAFDNHPDPTQVKMMIDAFENNLGR
jgi:hypothetical protein